MPTYEYECADCAKKFDVFQSMKDEPLLECPSCKKNTLKRLIGTGAGIIFKGSGFYETDYRSDNYKKASKKENSDTQTTSKTTEKTDAAKKDKAVAKSGE